jgi:hypothetical protein
MFALVQQVASPLYFYSFQNLSSAPASQSPVLFFFCFALPPNTLYVCPSPLSQHVFFPFFWQGLAGLVTEMFFDFFSQELANAPSLHSA